MGLPTSGRGKPLPGRLARRPPKQLARSGKLRSLAGGKVRSQPTNQPILPKRWLHWFSLALVALILWSAASLLILSLRWGTQLMLNPEALPPWLQAQFLGETAQPNEAKPITLEALSTEVTNQGRALGKPLVFTPPQSTDTKYWLVPIQEVSKQTDAAKILELRLYQQLPKQLTVTLQPLSTLPVSPLAPEVIRDSLRGASDKAVPPRRSLPLTTIVSLRSSTPKGYWLTLQGQWQRSGPTLRYGQLVYVNLETPSLEPLISWSSPANQPPQWLNLDDTGPTDLLVDRTLGLEPALSGYRLQAKRAGVQLLPISLAATPVDIVDPGSAYYDALVLARSGLWSQAAQQLQSLKTKLKKDWTPSAEAQLRLVASHAERTQIQADRQWSSPSQQILALLIDGRWEAALKQLEVSPSAQEALMQGLSQDQGRFWNRVNAAIRTKPPNPAVLVWGGLILKAQQTPQTASDWLTQQKASPAVRKRFQALTQPPTQTAQRSKAPTSTPTQPTVTVSAASGPPVAAILGTARSLPNPDLSQWQRPDATQSISLASEDTWYEIQAVAWQQADNWASPAEPTAWGENKALWQQVQSALQPTLTLLVWITPTEARPLSLRPRAVQVQNGQLKILATGLAVPDPGQRPALAFSQNSLVWLDPSGSQSTSGQQVLRDALKQIVSPYAAPEESVLTSLLAQSRLHRLSVTGDGRSDFLLTLNEPALQTLSKLGVPCDRKGPKTLILNPDGQILYNDLLQSQVLVALTQPKPSQPLALLVEQNSQYRVQRWSSVDQRYE
ncbi:MAG TPA: hypothetical protein V6D07_08590 [Trichocoleus sp.]